MAGDPTGFLGAVVGTSGALVAIVGGLLVARFVGLDSEQQSAEKLLREGEERLDAARRRASDAHRTLVEVDRHRLVDDAAVLVSIEDGTADPVALLRTRETALTEQEVAALIGAVQDELKRARSMIEDFSAQTKSRLPDWDDFERAYQLNVEGLEWPEVWKWVYDAAQDKREDDLNDEERQRNPSFLVTAKPPVIPRVPSLPATLSAEQWRQSLLVSDQRTQQRAEDIEDDVARLKREHDAISRPDARLWWAIGILVYFAAVGIGLPLWEMSMGPGRFSWLTTLTLVLFSSALFALLLFLVLYLASLQSRHRG